MEKVNYRHGEAFLRRIEKMPKGKAKHVQDIIVAHSETGHHHVLESKYDIAVLEPENLGDSLFVELLNPGKLVHQKQINRHNDITVQPGVYEVIQKKEYNPFTQAMERVWD